MRYLLFYLALSGCFTAFAQQLPAWQQPQTPATNPTLPAGIDAFTATFSATPPAPTTPQLAEWTRTAGPDETIVLTGENLTSFTGVSAGKDTRFVLMGRDGKPRDGQIQRLDGQKAALTLPADLPPWSFYFLWARNQTGFSRPVAMNRADAWWVGPKDANRGQTIAVHGRNLAKNNGTAQSWVYVENGAGTLGQWVTPLSANPYRVTFVVPPALANGEYTVWVHNGHGGSYGWSDPVPMTVLDEYTYSDTNVQNILNFGAIANDTLDDSPAVQAAIQAAENSTTNKTIYIPAGTFIFKTSVYPKSGTRLQGAGKDLTILKCSDNYSPDSYGMMLTNGLSNFTIQDLTFDANRTMRGYIGSVLYIRFSYNVKLLNVRINAQGYAPLDLHPSQRVFIKNCDFVGQNTFFGTAREVYIDSLRYQLTNDIQAGLFFWGSRGVSITNSTCKDFDSSDTTKGDGWGEGRWIAIADTWSVNQNYYIADNATTDLTVRPTWWNQNSGEQILWEGGNIDFRGKPVSAGSSTATFSTTIATETGRVLVVTKGRGLGQIRTIAAVDQNTKTITVDKPWNVVPDSTSQLDLGKFNDHFVIYKNYLDAKPRAVASIEHIASAAIQPYGGTTNLIVDGNTAHQTRAFLPNWTLTNKLGNDWLMQPNFFNLVVNNVVQGVRFGYAQIAGGPYPDPHPTTEIPFLGNTVRNNQFQGVLQGAIGFAPLFTQSISIDMAVFERNTATNSPIGFEAGSFRVANQILRKNTFSAGSGATGYAVGPSRLFRLRENTWTGYGTTYLGALPFADTHLEAPHHVVSLTATNAAAPFDTLFTLWNSGKIPFTVAVADNASWLQVLDGAGAIDTEADSRRVRLRISPAGLPAEQYVANLNVGVSGPQQAIYTVELTVTGTLPRLVSAQSGLWHTPATWNQNRTPTAADSVVIAPAHSVTVGQPAQAATMKTEGTLLVASQVRSLSVGFPLVTTYPDSIPTSPPISYTNTLFSNATPPNPSFTDTQPVELGVKFSSSTAGTIRAIRFYRGAASPTGYVVNLWTATGTLVASATVTADPGPVPGWQTVPILTAGNPVTIAAGQTYVVSYYSPTGNYPFENNTFANPVVSGTLTALAGPTSGGNGVYRYGAGGGFPTETYNNTNYFVDVEFVGVR